MRLQRLQPQGLSLDQRQVYDAIAGGKRAQVARRSPLVGEDGALEGPFNAMLYAPKVGMALQALGAAIRYETGLSSKVREVSILIVAAKWNSAFEQKAHEALALDAGVTPQELELIRSGNLIEGESREESVSWEVVFNLTHTGDLTDDQYETARQALGEEAIVELTTLVGYYSTLALQLRVFRV